MKKRLELPGTWRANRGSGAISRRSVLHGGLALGAGLAAPSILVRNAHGQDARKVTFISEESSPKAQAVYDRINADFEKETGIKVTMEYPGFANIAQRVATLIASGTPAELVWYGAGSAMEVALQGQLDQVIDLGELALQRDFHGRSGPVPDEFGRRAGNRCESGPQTKQPQPPLSHEDEVPLWEWDARHRRE